MTAGASTETTQHRRAHQALNLTTLPLWAAASLPPSPGNTSTMRPLAALLLTCALFCPTLARSSGGRKLADGQGCSAQAATLANAITLGGPAFSSAAGDAFAKGCGTAVTDAFSQALASGNAFAAGIAAGSAFSAGQTSVADAFSAAAARAVGAGNASAVGQSLAAASSFGPPFPGAFAKSFAAASASAKGPMCQVFASAKASAAAVGGNASSLAAAAAAAGC